MMLRGIRTALRRLRYIRGFAVPLRDSHARRDHRPMIPGHFPPDAIHVRRGIRITWFAGGPTTDSSLTATTGGASESPLIPVGRVFTTTMNTTGNFTYGCEPNSLMTRSGIVE